MLRFGWRRKRRGGEKRAVDQAVVQHVDGLLGKTTLGEGVKTTIRKIAKGEAGERISLMACDLGPTAGAAALAAALKNSPSTKILILRGNDLGLEGARHLAQGLQHVSNLEVLNLSKNGFGPEGVRAIAKSLLHMGNLQKLFLQQNDVGTEGARAIGAVLARNRKIDVVLTDDEEAAAFNYARPATAPDKKGTGDDNDDDDDDGDGAESSAAAKQPISADNSNRQRNCNDGNSFVAHAGNEHQDAAPQAASMEQLQQQLAATEKANQQLEKSNEQLKQQLDTWQELAETILNLNIPSARFSDKAAVTDSDGEPIATPFSSLHTATLAGHCVAIKDIEPIEQRPRFRDLLACRDPHQARGADSGTATSDNERLHRETLILLTMRHPNVVSFLGLSHDEQHQTLSLVLSWAEGGSLYDRLHVLEDVPTLTEAQRARIAMEVAGAMQFLHAHGVVHRDLKSPSVLLDGSLSAKITDFGLSAFKKDDKQTLTYQQGEPLWSSPEQLMGGKLYADTDVFSFGVLYWELCFNCKPWHQGAKTRKGVALIFLICNKYKAHKYLPVDEEINGTTLSAAQQQLLNGCFDVQGHRLDFSQLHQALREVHIAAVKDQALDEQQQTEMLLGSDTAVWKFPPSLLETVKAVTKQLSTRPSVSIAPLDLQRDIDAIKKLLAEAGGPTAAEQAAPLKPFGKTLAAVAITHDKQKEAAFNGALARNKTRYRGHLTSGNRHPFSPKYEHDTSTKEPTNEEEKQVLRRVTRATAYSVLDPSLLQEDPPLRLQRVFHGVTSWGAVVGILGGDFASLQQLDGGLYGAGFYFTPDLDYALAYTRPCTGALPAELAALGVKDDAEYQVVLACDVQYGNPYPVLDAKKFNGKPLVSGHDAHVAVVDCSDDGWVGAKPFTSHIEWTQAGKRPVAEIAMNDPSCVLVRSVLVFEP